MCLKSMNVILTISEHIGFVLLFLHITFLYIVNMSTSHTIESQVLNNAQTRTVARLYFDDAAGCTVCMALFA